ncbi:hypothetical protein [Paraburkholderia lacunae]|uniref:hypothetical protein n=1 Tax=Paraburkholderia lacunae TaxID=2211104 RepID=UPI0010585F59|nr:hypothetical protein [Paraburkholderia lacunae]
MLIAFLFVAPIAILGLFWIGSRIDPQTGQWRPGRHAKTDTTTLVLQSTRKEYYALPHSEYLERFSSSAAGNTMLESVAHSDPKSLSVRKFGSI